MLIKELTTISEGEIKFGKWTITTGATGKGAAWVTSDRSEYIGPITTNSEEETIKQLKATIRDKTQEKSTTKPNISDNKVTRTVGTFNTATTNEIFNGVVPGMMRYVHDGNLYLEFVETTLYEDDPEMQAYLRGEGFKNIKNRQLNEKEGVTPVYQTSLTPQQVKKFGLEYSGIYGLDAADSKDTDIIRYSLTVNPIDYLEGKKAPKTFPFPTFAVSTWIKGEPERAN